MAKLIDTYASTIKAIARDILENAPAGLIDRSRERLALLLEIADPDALPNYFGLEFGDYHANLWVELKRVTEFASPIVDDEETWFHGYDLVVKVTWSSGGEEPSEALARIEFIASVARYAVELQKNFSAQALKLWKTKAEREAHEAERAAQVKEANAREATELLASLMKDEVTGMRVGQLRTIIIDTARLDLASQWKPGEVVVRKRNYKLTVVVDAPAGCQVEGKIAKAIQVERLS